MKMGDFAVPASVPVFGADHAFVALYAREKLAEVYGFGESPNVGERISRPLP
jgi:hypothetical protein